MTFLSSWGCVLHARHLHPLLFSLRRRLMNLPQLEDLGSLNSALLSLRSLEELVLDLSGCHVSLEMRTELQKSIRTLKRRRGTLDLLWWISIIVCVSISDNHG